MSEQFHRALRPGVVPRACAFAMLAFAAAHRLQAQDVSPAEQSGFDRHTTHEEMMDYLVSVRATSTDMRLASYGESREGRELPYAIFSRPLVSQPWEAALLGKPIVLLAANVHGGERTLRESLLVLIRELATAGTPEPRLLDDLTILVAPQINPDGFSASQRGTRGNAWGIDLNRDYIKLEHPEIASYVGNLINGWHPHVYVDGHNGGSFPYNINYQCPSSASPDQRITLMCDEEIFPFVDERMHESGFKSWYYTGGTRTRWNTGGFQARIGRNYGGFANTIGILFESPGGQGLEHGVRSGLVAFKAVLEYVRDNAEDVMTTVNRARRETLAMGLAAEGEVAVDMRYGPEDRRVTYEVRIGRGDTARVIEVESDSLMKKPIPLRTRPRPYAYILPRDATDAVAMLQRHGITVEMLEDTARIEVQAYAIGEVAYAPQYNHAATVRIDVADVVTFERTFPRGTYVVPTGQMLGRVAAHMLEPETDDNVVYWNAMDELVPRPRPVTSASDGAQGGDPDADGRPRRGQQGPPLVPIFKLMSPTPLPTRIIE